MTIKEFYKEAMSQGKENYEMVTIKMGKDRKDRWLKVIPRYGIRGNVVFLELGGEIQHDNA